jgi:Ca-activated chloride channel family protein
VIQAPRLVVKQRGGEVTTRFARDVVPGTLPDFFAGDQIVILGRWEGTKPHRFTIEDGASRGSFGFDLNPQSASHRNMHVARLWATRKIAVLIDEIQALGASGTPAASDPRFKELVDEVVALSTKFGVLTEYTAFLATDPGLRADGAETRPGEMPDNIPMAAAPARARDEFAKKTQVRAGAGGVAQQMNTNAQHESQRFSGKQVYIAADMKERELGGVQQVADRALFYRAGRWIDSDLLKDENAAPEMTVEFGTPEFAQVVHQLAAEGRQGMLARGGDVYLRLQGKRVLVRCP